MAGYRSKRPMSLDEQRSRFVTFILRHGAEKEQIKVTKG
jgi:RNA:NAD 2'-phosphotransferase (TPT1/KptA family)